MKVRVSYATEVSDLPDKMSELIQKNISTSKEVSSLINLAATALNIDGDDSVEYSYQIIDKIRKKLTAMDESLADVSGLMGGYISNILNPPQIEGPSTPAEGSSRVWDSKAKAYKEDPIPDQEQE